MDIEKTIDNMTELTKSQQDRLHLKEIVFDDLIKFLQSHIKKISSKNALREKIEKVLMDRVEPLNEDESLSNFELIKLLEILSRNEVDSTTALVKAISESSRNNENKNKGDEPNTPKVPEETTQKNIESAKKIISTLEKIDNIEKFIKDLEKTESSKEELEKNHKE